MIEEIKKLLSKSESINESKIKELFTELIKSKGITHNIDNYIGDYPTFIEPVFLGENVKIGDDVLLGPNAYIGENVELSDYVEISNSIILDNVIVDKNKKLENCIVSKENVLKF